MCGSALFFDQNLPYPLVKSKGKYGNDAALQKVQGHHGEQHQCADIFDGGVHGSAHFDDGFHGHTEQGGEFGKQIHRIENAAEDRHAGGACDAR